MRIVTGCISHESSTFTPVATTWSSFFERFGDARGAAIIENFRRTNTPTGGFIEGAEVHGFELIPTIFADRNDNPGGGSPGDSTGVLRTFIEAGLKDACVLYIVDPEAVARCQQAGVGATLTLDVGAKSSPLQGTPVRMTAEVITCSDGHFHYDGPMYAGLACNMGPSAHICQGGIHVILTNGRDQPFDTAFARTLGLDPRQMRYISVKSAAHFRAAFEPWAGAIYVVSEPSVHSADTGTLTYKHLGRKLYPFDPVE